jgi:hypothetical protein
MRESIRVYADEMNAELLKGNKLSIAERISDRSNGLHRVLSNQPMHSRLSRLAQAIPEGSNHTFVAETESVRREREKQYGLTMKNRDKLVNGNKLLIRGGNSE